MVCSYVARNPGFGALDHVRNKPVYLAVLISSRRNLFMLNKFLISDKILITCWEMYFEVLGRVNQIKMGNFPEN